MSQSPADYERCLVAGCKRRPAIVDELRIKSGDFTDAKARAVFDAVNAVRLSGRQVDEVSLWGELGSKVPVEYVASLPEAAVFNAAWYLGRIRELALRTRIKTTTLQLTEYGDRTDMETAEILETIDREVTALSDEERGEIVWLKDVIRPAVEDIGRRAQNPAMAVTGIPSGYWDVDNLTDGFQPGELIIVAARPSLGKTAFAVSVLVNMAVRGGIRCGFFSCEMSEVLIGQRFLANVGRLNLGAVRRGVIAKNDGARLLSAAEELYHEQLLLCATPNIQLVDLKGLARSMVRRGARLLVVDYLTLIQHGEARTPRHERVGEISKQLKGLARELNVPIIVLSQLARTAEGKEPNLAELRQSGEIEEDSDVVMLLHREREEKSDAIATKLIVAKNRNGPCGTVRMIFHPQCCRFELEETR